MNAPDVLMVLVALIGIAASIANKKKAKAQREQRAAQRREAAGPQSAAAPSASNRTSPTKASTAAPVRNPSSSPSKFPPTTPKRPAATAQKPQPKPASPAYSGTPRYTHVVMSTLEGGHTHTESSMTGEESCPPPKAVPNKQLEPEQHDEINTGKLLSFQPNSVLQGVLYAEILGKPKSLQR